MIKETGSIAQITVEANMPLPSGEEEEEAAPVDSLASDGQHEAVHLVPLPSGALTKETNDEKLAAAAEEEARLAAAAEEEERLAAAIEEEAKKLPALQKNLRLSIEELEAELSGAEKHLLWEKMQTQSANKNLSPQLMKQKADEYETMVQKAKRNVDTIAESIARAREQWTQTTRVQELWTQMKRAREDARRQTTSGGADRGESKEQAAAGERQGRQHEAANTEEAKAGSRNRGRDKGSNNEADDGGADAKEATYEGRNEETHRGDTKEDQTKEKASGMEGQGTRKGRRNKTKKKQGSGRAST